MADAKHTPGPLHVTQQASDPRMAFVVAADGRIVADVWNVPGTNGAQALADATLFAAAPELLAAVQHAIEALRCGEPNARLNAMRDGALAIAKATGSAA